MPHFHKKASHNTKKSRPLYRIVSNPIEPFVITSHLDEGVITKDSCKDGLLCLDIESDLILNRDEEIVTENKMNLTRALNSVLNHELMIALIKGFKYISDFENSDNEKMKMNEKKLIKYKCCTGYIVNLLQKLSTDLDLSFEFYLASSDKTVRQNSSKRNVANTRDSSVAISHVTNGVAHIAAGPLVITNSRLKLIDFSLPFLYSKYSLLIKQEKRGADDLFMFMKPFTYTTWAFIFLVVLIAAFSLSLLEFNSPFGLNPKGRARSRNFTFGSAINVVFSLIFMHTTPAKSPKSWTAKWTQNVIALFALVFLGYFTAQMAAFLSSGEDTLVLKEITDEELLTMKIGYLHSSSLNRHICRNKKDFYRSLCTNSIDLKSNDEGMQSIK